MTAPSTLLPNGLTATQIVMDIGAGRLSSEEVVRGCLDRIAVRDADVGAWSYVDPDRAIDSARQFDRRPVKGPLAGVPFGVKDIFDTVDMPTEWGTPIHRGRNAGRDE